MKTTFPFFKSMSSGQILNTFSSELGAVRLLLCLNEFVIEFNFIGRYECWIHFLNVGRKCLGDALHCDLHCNFPPLVLDRDFPCLCWIHGDCGMSHASFLT